VTRVEQQYGGRHHLVLGQPVAHVTRLDQRTEEVRTGAASAVGDESAQVGVELRRRRDRPLLGRVVVRQLVEPDDVARPRAEPVPVVGRHAEQFRDHSDRQRLGQGGHELQPIALDGRVEELVGQPAYRLAQRRHPTRRERRRDQPARPGVLRRLEVEQRLGVQPVPGGEDIGRPPRREDPPEPTVSQQRGDVGVAGDQPAAGRLIEDNRVVATQDGVRRIGVGQEVGVGRPEHLRHDGHAVQARTGRHVGDR
jgi:hypothetical protein